MIAFLRGTLVSSGQTVVLDVGGIGFTVQVSSRTAQALPEPGSVITLHTWMQVREDGVGLYGFLEAEERELFARLVGVNGLGPKGALALLAAYGSDQLAELIVRGDSAALVKVPGIGPKLAQRIVLELKDRVVPSRPGDYRRPRPEADEALAALMALGYSPAEAEPVVKQAKRVLGEESPTEEVLAYCLKQLDPTAPMRRAEP